MDIAKFLEQPIRSNPRRQSQPFLSSALLPPTPCEMEFPVSLSAVSPSSLSELDAIPTSEFDSLPADSVASVSSIGHSPVSHGRTDMRTMSTASLDQTTTEEARQRSGSQRMDGATKRKRITRAACSACRKRKAKCDGKRPSCSTCTNKRRNCEYLAEEGVSSQAATRRRLDGYANVLQMLRDAEPDECSLILRDFREATSLSEAVQAVQRRGTFSTNVKSR